MNSKFDWNLKEIFEDSEQIEKAISDLYRTIKKIEGYKGKLNKGIENLCSFYKEYEKSLELFEKIYAFGMLNYHQDMSKTDSIMLYKRVETLSTDYVSALSFTSPEISNIDNEILEGYLKDSRLKPYERSIRNIIKEKEHILSKEIEEVLAKYSEIFSTPENTYEIFTNTEFDYPNIKDENGNELKMSSALYSKHMMSKSETVRKQAFESMYSLYKRHINSISELYLSRVKASVVTSRLRNYHSSLDAATSHDESTVEVYKTLVEEVNKNIKLNYEYINLKAKLLKKDKLHIYDLNVNPLDTLDKTIEYTEAQKMVIEALAPLGEEYRNGLEQAFKNNWIDVYEKENKMSGGYNLGVHTVHPFILLNYINSARDVSVIAHELGHAMHSHYSSKAQSIMYSNCKIMVAEVASTVNEILLANYLINKETDKKTKAVLINEQLDMIRATLIKQTMYAEFEETVHARVEQNESLTSEKLNGIYYNLVEKYYGDSVIADDYIKYEWARIPHFYRCFYVYKYSTGIISAIYIASNILTGNKKYVEKYIDMLSQGGARDSLELLKMVDVDLEDKKTYETAFKYFEENLNQLKKLIND